MGCTASRLDNEDTVRRCKDRRRLIKDAVLARHLLASAHADYLRSLRLTSSSLLRFAQGEPLSVSAHTPPIVLPSLPSSNQNNTSVNLHFNRQHNDNNSDNNATLPPTPASNFSRNQTFIEKKRNIVDRDSITTSSSSPTILTSKLPHILTPDSSFSASFRNNRNKGGGGNVVRQQSTTSHSVPRNLASGRDRTYSDFSNKGDLNVHNPGSFRDNGDLFNYKSNYANTPSQSSSAWDWENFYPPSPPDSEFFDRRKAELEQKAAAMNQSHHLPPEQEEIDDEDNDGHRSESSDEAGDAREEIHCSEWGADEHDHYATSSTSSTGSEAEQNANDRVNDFDARSDGMTNRSHYSGFGSARMEPVSEMKANNLRRDVGSSSAGWDRNGREETSSLYSSVTAAEEMKMVVRHQNLVEIVTALEEYFIKAAAAGDKVSELLEIGRAQLDRSFRQLKKTVYHSNSLLSVLSSSWSSKPPLAIRYKLDTGALAETDGGKSHGLTLERLLAWEKKLYEEVKARESVKIEHEKKLSTLQSQEYKGKDDAKLDKTKASIRKLQSLIIVTSQAATTTSSAITKVRDNELAPQLVDICFELLKMWRQMHQCHEVQNHIVQQVRGLVNRASAGETTDLHRLATRDLEAAVQSWHSSFFRLIKYQREYVHSLYGWLKLTLFQVSNDGLQRDHASPVAVELTAFCDEWKQALDQLPDRVPTEAIKSFMNVIHEIHMKQKDELKIKKQVESFSKELEKKTASLRSIEKKYYQSYSMVGIALPGSGHETDGQVFDTRDPLAEKKSEIAGCRSKVEEEMTKHSKAVGVTRSMTLNNIQAGLPGVFHAMSAFSGLFAEALQGVCRRAGRPESI